MDERQIIRRKRVKHVLTFDERLLEAARQARDSASTLPDGEQRETLLRFASDSEAAVRINRWISSPSSSPADSNSRRRV